MSNRIKDAFEDTAGLNAAQEKTYWDSAHERLTENTLLDFVKEDEFDGFFISVALNDNYKDKTGYAFTDAEQFLNLVYRMYFKYPELHLDQELEKGFIRNFQSEHLGLYFAAINTLNQQLTNEIQGISPFSIDNPEVYVAFRVSMIRREDSLKQSNVLKGKLYENHLYGFAEEVNEKIKKYKGY